MVAQYAFEVYTPTGTFVAELGGLATNRHIRVSRNESGEITFDLDTHQMKLLAAQYNTTTAGILAEGVNELRVRRNDTYLKQGGRIDYVLDKGSGADKVTSVRVPGFLEMLADRYVETQRVFTATQAATILWTVINEMQTASTNFWATPAPTAGRATLGITQGSLDTTIGTKDRTYEGGKSVKDILTQMTELSTTDTDIEITHTKALNVYERMGSNKPLLVFELGRNIIDYEVPRDATGLANRVISYGAGTGEAARVESIDQDTTSETTYKVRQHVLQLNSVEETATLSAHGGGYVAAAKDPITTPKITVDLSVDVDMGDFWVGDAVTVRIIDDDLPTAIDGLYKVEEIDLTIADNGTETAKLTLSEG